MGEGTGGGTNATASREAAARLFQNQNATGSQRDSGDKGSVPRGAMQQPRPAEKLTAAEKRLQDSIQRIEGERSRRANAANVWRNDGTRNSTWKDW